MKLPKLGWVKFAKSRTVDGRIHHVAVRRNPSGKYFVSILAEMEVQELPKKIQLQVLMQDERMLPYFLMAQYIKIINISTL